MRITTRSIGRGRGRTTPRKIAEVLDILNDGQWHSISDIRLKARLNENQALQITKFLSEYEFITVDDAKDKVKLTEDVRRFLLQKATS